MGEQKGVLGNEKYVTKGPMAFLKTVLETDLKNSHMFYHWATPPAPMVPYLLIQQISNVK